MNITFCIPSKNNLRYLKSSIKSILENSFYDNKIIVYVDSDNDGTIDWLDKNGIKYIQNTSSEPKGIAYGYDRCIEHAQTEVVCMFHADMYMAKGFDVNAIKHLKDKKIVVSATRIEPPLHPEGLEKIVKNFGMYPEDFKKDEFDVFCKITAEKNKDRVTYGIFAPWVIYKSELVNIGLHDEYFHSYHEDSDIFNRLILNGVKCIQSWDSLVYHLTCRGGQFQDGVENITTDSKFHEMKFRSAKNYIRKWGSWIKNDEYQHPIIPPKYDIGFKIKNANYQIISHLEMWCSTLAVDIGMHDINDYIVNEQKNTLFNLNDRVKPFNYNLTNDIIVEFDAKKLNNESFKYIQQLASIINDSGEVGKFEMDVFIITINKLVEKQTELIFCKNENNLV
jgi:glycosyltransferase involved in cell wall biosynthesis